MSLKLNRTPRFKDDTAERTWQDSEEVLVHPRAKAGLGDLNWCESKYCNTIQDQKDCASGWAFSAVAAIETIYAINGGNKTSLSVQECVDCKSNGCTSNRTADDCLDYVKDHEIALNSSYPYTGSAGSCKKSAKKSDVKVTAIQTVTAQNETALINQLNIGPVIASVDASQTIFINYSTGIINSLACKMNDNNHWVLIVGYGSTDSQSDISETATDYYVIRNSWGTDWGLTGQTTADGFDASGYGYIARNGDGEGICGIQMELSYPVIDSAQEQATTSLYTSELLNAAINESDQEHELESNISNSSKLQN